MKTNDDIKMQNERIRELEDRVWKASGMVKALTAMPNNVVFIVLYEAYHKLRRHPSFKQNVKRAFNSAMQYYKDYEKQLYGAMENRMFHVDDLVAETRKRYGNITDKDYYDLWQDMGSTGYHLTRPHIDALTHKFQLSLEKRDVPHADILAYVLTASTMLSIAVGFYKSAVELCLTEFKLPKRIVELLYSQFSLEKVEKAWSKAACGICTKAYELEDIETRNIEISIKDISDIFSDEDNMLVAVRNSVENMEELFRTKGEMKKMLRMISEAYE